MSPGTTRGITFSETMAGPFALGADEPEAGRDRGRREGTRLTMNADVAVTDLDAFVDDPSHLGGLTGTIDFPPLGTGLVASAGVFNLFSPADDPGMKHMVYELAFAVDGKPHYLAGHKRVADDRGFDLWSDTTTLYTTLHAGDGKDGPVIGAGILTLGAIDLAELMSTVRVTGTENPVEMAATVAKFGAFFMAELWDSYGPEVLKAAGGRG